MSTTLETAISAFFTTTRTSFSIDNSLKELARSISDAAQGADQAECNKATAALATAITNQPPSIAALSALVAGSIVEHGANASPLTQPVSDLIRRCIPSALEFIEAFQTEIDNGATEEQAAQATAQALPEQHDAFQALDHLYPPAVLVLCADAEARRNLRPIAEQCQRLGQYHQTGSWLYQLLSVLDHEPALVIEAVSRKGFEVRLNGIADNYQLHMLLIPSLVGNADDGWLTGQPLLPEMVAVVTGEGPQSIDTPFDGRWNLYTWRAVQPDLSLPDPDNYEANSDWIWGEGIPADIPVFEGFRVILLGPPSYVRSTNCCRIFDRLRADVKVVRKLGEMEVENWLSRMLSAKHNGVDKETTD